MLSAQTPGFDNVDPRKLIRQLNDSESTFKLNTEWKTPAQAEQAAQARRLQLYEEEQRAAKMRFDKQGASQARGDLRGESGRHGRTE